MEAAQGKVLGERWICLEKIYEGAMSSVYRGVERQSQRLVAIKVLSEEKSQTPLWRRRFDEEIQLLQRLEHPNLLQYLERGCTTGDQPFFVTAWVEGQSLRDGVRAGSFSSIKLLVPMITGVVNALAYLHQNGIVHCDVKPANILVGATNAGGMSSAQLIDFGIAHPFNTPRRQEFESFTLGTPLYMSPEQAQNLPEIGPASDIYALGVTLFEALTGHTPFHGENIYSIMAGHVHVPPPLPRAFAPVFQSMPEIERVLLWALEKSPAQRPADVWSFWQTLLGAFLQYGMITHDDLPQFANAEEDDTFGEHDTVLVWEDLEDSEDFLGLPLHPEAPTPRPAHTHPSEPLPVLPKPASWANAQPQISTPRPFSAIQSILSSADLPLHPEAPTPPQAHPNASDWLHAQSKRPENAEPRERASGSKVKAALRENTPADLSLFAPQTPAPRHTREPQTAEAEELFVYAQAPKPLIRIGSSAPSMMGASAALMMGGPMPSMQTVSPVPSARTTPPMRESRPTPSTARPPVIQEEAPQAKGRVFSSISPSIKKGDVAQDAFSWVDFFTRTQRVFEEVHGMGLYDLAEQSWQIKHATNSGYTGFLQFRLMLAAFHELYNPSDGTCGLEFVVEGLHRQEDFSFYYAPFRERWMLVVALDADVSVERAFRISQRIKRTAQRFWR